MDNYQKRKIKPLLDELKAVWKLSDKDEWLASFKESLGDLVEKVYTDGFEDGGGE